MKRKSLWPLLLLFGFVGYMMFPLTLSAVSSGNSIISSGGTVFTEDSTKEDEPSYYIQNEFVQAGVAAQPELELQIDQWISSLYDRPGFDTWKGAQWEVLPLGPGLHGWVVLLNQGDRQVGYLIVSAAEDGTYHLTEYGTGSKPLYSMRTLHQSLVQLGLIDSSYDQFEADQSVRKEAHYSNGLQALWKVTVSEKVHYFDAKSGEELPDLSSVFPVLQSAKQGTSSSVKSIVQSAEAPEFDPFEQAYWIQGTPLQEWTEENVFDKWTSSRQVTYTARLFDGAVYNPYAVTGIHRWNNGSVYMALDQDGPRYFPFETLRLQGQWFEKPE
ncbi:hypothetical protein [Paenibacillus sp. J2TS4]|uniref:hypothetical protein n=1 Tax=Paenibacillus sp. J2TS4 TaxID=2807194 RepID=UPI001B0D319E|nr:hypothetical protein [Paenibacillus sp. J2TS4]GIP33982.1 hypothetical protein J2TS4_31920 [Paenibacillus sp. J2TS4]